MKIVHIVQILLVILCISCKDKTTVKTTKLSNKAVDINSIYQHYTSKPSTISEIDENALIDYIVDHDLSPKRLESGLYYQIHEIGTGDIIKFGDRLKVHYRGKYLNGKVFQSSFNTDPLEFEFANRGLIRGWIEGLQYLNEGAKATFLIPSKLAYESYGKGDIPGDTPLVFDIEVVEVEVQ